MNTKNGIIQNRTYSTPKIVRIQLDNEISLALESSNPPSAPGWGQNLNAPKYLNNDPFKDHIA